LGRRFWLLRVFDGRQVWRRRRFRTRLFADHLELATQQTQGSFKSIDVGLALSDLLLQISLPVEKRDALLLDLVECLDKVLGCQCDCHRFPFVDSDATKSIHPHHHGILYVQVLIDKNAPLSRSERMFSTFVIVFA
jgi:hypothetical protein